MGKRKQRGKQKGNKQKVIVGKWEMGEMGNGRNGKRVERRKEYKWSSLTTSDWS